jgi:hypothetical protein
MTYKKEYEANELKPNQDTEQKFKFSSGSKLDIEALNS